jgi:excisionase family DNA binding protein
MADERWFTVEQIAELLQVTEQTVRRWLRSGRLVGRNFSGRTGYRIRQSDLDAFLANENRQGKAKAA